MPEVCRLAMVVMDITFFSVVAVVGYHGRHNREWSPVTKPVIK
jgi:hypothetical protein